MHAEQGFLGSGLRHHHLDAVAVEDAESRANAM